MKYQSKSIVSAFFLIMALLGGTGLTGCSIIRKNQIKTELESLEPQKAASERRLNEINQKISALQNNARSLQAGIKSQSNRTLSYMKEHILAVACMASVGYSIGKDNLFSKEVNDIINTSSVLCVIGVILSEDFRNEVSEVVEIINKSDEDIKAWQSEIKNLNAVVEAGYEIRKKEEAVYNSLAEKVRSLKSELAQLE